MHSLILFCGTVFMGFFAIMNPIANTPIFLGLTSDLDARSSKLVAAKALLIALIIVLVFSVLGKAIFELFGISLPAFRITGGILVFLVGFQLLHGKSSAIHSKSLGEEESDEEAALSVAVSPLATPILAGPGTIVTAMNFAASGSIAHVILTVAVFALMCLITFLLFTYGAKFVRAIGKEAVAVVTRMMGLILAVIGTQMLIQGIFEAIEMFSKAT
jgi:multiple antibiotic resistance protein